MSVTEEDSPMAEAMLPEAIPESILTLTLDDILKTIVPPTQAPYSNSIQFKERKYKVFPNDGQRLYLIVFNKEILAVLDAKLKDLPERSRNSATSKINACFDNKLKNLESGYYAFDIMLGPRSLTVVDVLFENSVSLAEHTWKERLQRIQSFNFAKSKTFLPNKIKIMDSAPTEHIDFSGVSGQLIVRDLPAFAMFTKEYLVSEVESVSRFAIVGEGSLKREFKVSLKPDEDYDSLAKIPNSAKRALTALAAREMIEMNKVADLSENDQLTVYNRLKAEFFKRSNGSTILKYTVYNSVLLIAGKMDDGTLAIFGTTKNKPAEIASRTVVIERPPLVAWSNGSSENRFADNTIRYFNPIFLVNCKRVNKYKGTLVNVITEDVKSYYHIDDIHETHDIYNEIDYVPELQTKKSNNTLTACSYNTLCREMSARINFDFTQNPTKPETKKAVDCIAYLLSYGEFRDDCWHEEEVAEQKLKRKLQVKNEKLVESLSKKRRYDSSHSVSANSDDDM